MENIDRIVVNGVTYFIEDALARDNIEKNSKRITNIEQGLPSENFETDNSVSYEKVVPENALSYAAIGKIGGMTRKFDEGLRSAPVTEVESVGANLIPYPYFDTTKTVNGITFTDNGDQSITINGTATENAYFILNNYQIVLSEGKYCLCGNSVTASTLIYAYITNKDYSIYKGDTQGNGNSFEISNEEVYCIAIVVNKGTTISNAVFRPMLNVGDVAYPYMPYVKHILPIAEAVQTLDGYGWGVNEACYNYIDFEKKQFVKNVQKIVLDGVNNKAQYVNVSNGLYYASIILPQNGINGASNFIIEHFKEKYEVAIGNSYIAAKNTLAIFHENQSLTTPDLWNDWLKTNNVTVCYELEQPEITDISHLISDDNLIKVEGGGSITMKNEYQYAVPSEITYQLKGVTQ